MATVMVSGETASELDLTARVGADWSEPFTFLNADGTPYSLGTKTIKASVRRSASGAVVKDLTVATTGNVATLSANFDGVRPVLAFYDLWEKDNLTSTWLCRAAGAFLVKPGMTVTT